MTHDYKTIVYVGRPKKPQFRRRLIPVIWASLLAIMLLLGVIFCWDWLI